MSELKDLVARGIEHLGSGGKDFTLWANRMVLDFGPLKEQELREVRQWSLLLAQQRAGPRPEKINCWEFMHCGREVHGRFARKSGVCPAALESRLDGLHGGKNAGRSCWVVAGTLCGSNKAQPLEEKGLLCSRCRFRELVTVAEGTDHLIRDDVMLVLLH